MKLTITEASAHLGYKSRTVLHRLHRAGLLRDYERGHNGRSVLFETHPEGRATLRQHVQALTQLRIDSPLAKPEPAAPEALDGLSDEELGRHCDAVMAGLDALAEPAPNWAAIAAIANGFLQPSAWGPPPWSPDQWATLGMVLSLAEEASTDG